MTSDNADFHTNDNFLEYLHRHTHTRTRTCVCVNHELARMKLHAKRSTESSVELFNGSTCARGDHPKEIKVVLYVVNTRTFIGAVSAELR